MSLSSTILSSVIGIAMASCTKTNSLFCGKGNYHGKIVTHDKLWFSICVSSPAWREQRLSDERVQNGSPAQHLSPYGSLKVPLTAMHS